MPIFSRLRTVLGSAAICSLAVEACPAPAFADDRPDRLCVPGAVSAEILPHAGGDPRPALFRLRADDCLPGAVRPGMDRPAEVPLPALPDGRPGLAESYGEPAVSPPGAAVPQAGTTAPQAGTATKKTAKKTKQTKRRPEAGRGHRPTAGRKHGGRRARAGRTGRGRAPGRVAAAAALRMLGTPFSWGGGSPQGPTRGIGRGARTVGFDCSGLTLYAWAQAGVRLGHYTGTQFRQGRRVARSRLRRGDLVFFGGGSGDPTHVGLYLGNGVMIHAPKTGDVVRTTRFLRSPYYRARYRGAIRPA